MSERHEFRTQGDSYAYCSACGPTIPWDKAHPPEPESREATVTEAERIAADKLLDHSLSVRWEGRWYLPTFDEDVRNDLLDALAQARRAGFEAGALDMRERAAKECEASYPCSCDDAYKRRGRSAPDCFRCVPLDEAAAEIRALLPAPASEEGK